MSLNGKTLHVEFEEALTSEENEFLSKYIEQEGLGLKIYRSRTAMTQEEKRVMKEMDEAIKRINAIPESEKKPLSQQLQDRMQNEAEAGYVPVSEEQRQKWRKQWLNPEAD